VIHVGIGDRVLTLELNLHKIWVLYNWNYFDKRISSQLKTLMKMFKDYYQSKSKGINPKTPTIEDLQKEVDRVNVKVKSDIISLVSEFPLNREENGYAHYVLVGGNKFVFPDP